MRGYWLNDERLVLEIERSVAPDADQQAVLERIHALLAAGADPFVHTGRAFAKDRSAITAAIQHHAVAAWAVLCQYVDPFSWPVDHLSLASALDIALGNGMASDLKTARARVAWLCSEGANPMQGDEDPRFQSIHYSLGKLWLGQQRRQAMGDTPIASDWANFDAILLILHDHGLAPEALPDLSLRAHMQSLVLGRTPETQDDAAEWAVPSL